MLSSGYSAFILLGLVSLPTSHAFNVTAKTNVVSYWGQNGSGAQATLASYCGDDAVDVLQIAFLNIVADAGGLPSYHLANACNGPTFPGTNLLNCAFLAADIKTCQSKGKLVTLSVGGAGANDTILASSASGFADQLYDLFLGGTSATRPFGDAILDGIDLDIEDPNSSTGLAPLVTQLRTRFSSDPNNKMYYISAAPQCPYPDLNLGAALNNSNLDAVYVQFYNNPGCDLSQGLNFNFATWDNWAKTVSQNKNVKVYIGSLASPPPPGKTSAYVAPATLAHIATDTMSKYSSFGGVMLWDVSDAWGNNRYDMAIKTALVQAAGGSGSASTSARTKGWKRSNDASSRSVRPSRIHRALRQGHA